MITELAPAKANLILQVGPRRPDGLHEICSLFASLELADIVHVEPLEGTQTSDDRITRNETAPDRVECPGVEGPNLAAAALAAYRAAASACSLPRLRVRIDKRIPVAAGLGGGSADAAATLRAADALSARPLGPGRLREIAVRLGADVPSQIEPRHALVTGAGEHVEAVDLPPLTLVLVPQREGLATRRVYAEADRRGDTRPTLQHESLRVLIRSGSLARLLAALENDLEGAARALRPELEAASGRLLAEGARAALISGSGPTVLGVFEELDAARAAADGIEGAVSTRLRPPAAGTRIDTGAESRSSGSPPDAAVTVVPRP